MTNNPSIDRRTLHATQIAAFLVDTEPYVSCDECFERIDEYAERIHTDAEHLDVGMRAHLRGCPACADELESMLDLLRRAHQG